MKQNVLILIEDGAKELVEAEAFSKDSANLYIIANDFETAKKLLDQHQGDMTDKMENWEPEDEEPKEQEHYRVSTVSQETIYESLEDYETDPKKRRVVERVKRAREFQEKKDRSRGLKISEYIYLSLLSHKDIYDGIVRTYDFAFTRGYRMAKADIKKKAAKK